MSDASDDREAFLQDLARQVRIQFRAGKTETEVSDWLQDLGLSAEAADYLVATCPRGETRVDGWIADVLIAQFDFSPMFGRSPDAQDRKRERQERRKKSRQLAETEPDSTFAVPGDSFAQVLARDATRPGWGGS